MFPGLPETSVLLPSSDDDSSNTLLRGGVLMMIYLIKVTVMSLLVRKSDQVRHNVLSLIECMPRSSLIWVCTVC